MTLKIISAEDILFEGIVSAVHLPGAMGAFTVLKNHASIISELTAGTVAYTHDGDISDSVDIQGGIVSVDRNIISVCVY